MTDVSEKLTDFKIALLRELSDEARQQKNPNAYYFLQDKLESHGIVSDITGAEEFTKPVRDTDIRIDYIDTSDLPEPSDPNYIGKRITQVAV